MGSSPAHLLPMTHTTQKTAHLEGEDNHLFYFKYLSQWEQQNQTSRCARRQLSLFRSRHPKDCSNKMWGRKSPHKNCNVLVQLTMMKLINNSLKKCWDLWACRIIHHLHGLLGTPKDSKDVKLLFYYVIRKCYSISFRTPIPVLSRASNSDDLHKLKWKGRKSCKRENDPCLPKSSSVNPLESQKQRAALH